MIKEILIVFLGFFILGTSTTLASCPKKDRKKYRNIKNPLIKAIHEKTYLIDLPIVTHQDLKNKSKLLSYRKKIKNIEDCILKEFPFNRNKNLVNQRGRRFRATPLHWAAYKNHFVMLKLLCQYDANVNAIAKDGKTPLEWAVSQGNIRSIEVLLGLKNGPPTRKELEERNASRKFMNGVTVYNDTKYSSDQSELAVLFGAKDDFCHGLNPYIHEPKKKKFRALDQAKKKLGEKHEVTQLLMAYQLYWDTMKKIRKTPALVRTVFGNMVTNRMFLKWMDKCFADGGACTNIEY